MNSNTKPSDFICVAGAIDPQSNAAAATKTSDYVDMAQFNSMLAVLNVGAITSTGKVDAKLVQAKDSSGTDKKDISGKAITQLTEAGTDSNKQIEINLFAEELDTANGFRYVALEVTNTTAAALVSAVILGAAGRYDPASDSNVSSVDEIV